SDFLLFAPRTYYRLFELYNLDIWPLQIATLLAGVMVLVLMHSRAPWRGRVIAAMLAACWLWIAWAFHWERYATINWAAGYFAAGFAIEAVLFICIGVVRDQMRFDAKLSVVARIGVGVFVFALVVQPLLGLLFGRVWQQAEVLGVAPDPTAVATLGLLLATNRIHWIALPIPVLWCLLSGTTLWVMNAADALVLPMVASLVLLLSLWRSAARR
ncbi:MAG: DUF6064 family protein, partial [Burkholderiaceae bacterium]